MLDMSGTHIWEKGTGVIRRLDPRMGLVDTPWHVQWTDVESFLVTNDSHLFIESRGGLFGVDMADSDHQGFRLKYESVVRGCKLIGNSRLSFHDGRDTVMSVNLPMDIAESVADMHDIFLFDDFDTNGFRLHDAVLSADMTECCTIMRGHQDQNNNKTLSVYMQK